MLALTLVLLIGVGFGALIEMEYPKSSGLPEGVKKADQLMIFFIFENYGNGLFRGLFVGCMISAALSTASSIIAVISSTVHLDLLEKKSRKFGRLEITGRVVSVITGIFCYILGKDLIFYYYIKYFL
jgi:Na+/proline symporter